MRSGTICLRRGVECSYFVRCFCIAQRVDTPPKSFPPSGVLLAKSTARQDRSRMPSIFSRIRRDHGVGRAFARLGANVGKKQAPRGEGLKDTARDCNLTLTAALRTNPRDSGIAWPGDANNLIMLVCNSFVNLNSKQPECHTGSDAPEILMVYRFNVIDSFPVHILAEIRQVETVKGYSVHHIPFHPVFLCIKRCRQRFRGAQQMMPLFQRIRLFCAQRNNDAQPVGNGRKHDNRASFVHLWRNAAMKIAKQDSAGFRAKFDCHSAPKKPQARSFVKDAWQGGRHSAGPASYRRSAGARGHPYR